MGRKPDQELVSKAKAKGYQRKKLKEKVAPEDYTSRLDAIHTCQQVKKQFRKQETEAWLDSWEVAYDKCVLSAATGKGLHK
jgi:hypothetical protein